MPKLPLSKLSAALDEITGSDTDSVIIITSAKDKTAIRTFGAKPKVRKAVQTARDALA